MKQLIDIHSHILPGVEDVGCPTKKEARAMLKAYEALNAEAVICTPHFGIHGVKGANVAESYQWIQTINSPVKRYLGQQILLTRFTLQDARRGIAKTLADSDRLFVDYELGVCYSAAVDIIDGMKELAKSEYKPILVQPEKYPGLQQYPELCCEIVNAGAQLQVNLRNIFSDNPDIRRTAQFLIDNRLAAFAGSNAHNTEELALVKDGIRWIYDHCPEKYADAIIHDHAAAITGNISE